MILRPLGSSTAYSQACWACSGESPARGRSWDSWSGLRCLQPELIDGGFYHALGDLAATGLSGSQAPLGLIRGEAD